jgi:hypothetical protein
MRQVDGGSVYMIAGTNGEPSQKVIPIGWAEIEVSEVHDNKIQRLIFVSATRRFWTRKSCGSDKVINES